MGTVKDAFDDTYRDYVVAGDPTSGALDPIKADIRQLGELIEETVAAGPSPWAVAGQTLEQYNAALADAAAALVLPAAIGTGTVTRGVAAGGEVLIPLPVAVPSNRPDFVEVTVNGVAQDAGVDFTTDGTTTAALSFVLSAGDAWRARHVRGAPA